ncbi:MAG TPA: asparaginase [Thermoleophilaceae bacterium]|nr:asparaginase [Thermoleophilaceae bacterium]
MVVCATGGTIAGSEDGDGQLTPKLGLETLIANVPGLSDVARLELVQLRQVPGSELTLQDVVEMASHFEQPEYDDAAGFVVVQGTDTIEESAFAFDLLWDRRAPVVVTGAMRPIGAPGSDGPPNLEAAIRVAGSPTARWSGVLVVLNQTVHAARFASKVHTTRLDAFQSPLRGPVGEVSEGRVVIWATAHREPPLAIPGGTEQTPVALRRITMGEDARGLSDIAECGYRGLVIEAMGAGHVPAALVEELASLASSIPVVLTSRTGSGELFHSTYGFPGSETDLLKRGLIPASGLDGPKARVKLSLLLMAGMRTDDIARAFQPDRPVGGDGPDDRQAVA